MIARFPHRALTLFQALVLVVLTQRSGDAATPFSGTIFLDPDIVTASDPSAVWGISYVGIGRRQVYDRRLKAFAMMDMHLARATYFDDRTIEVQVNPEFGAPEAAMVEAEKYARLVGQLPAVLRAKVQTMSIHKGAQPFGGGNANILIHTGQAALYEAQGIIEDAGQRTTLNVVATGSVPISYQWYLEESPDTSSPIEGANANSFTTPELSSTVELWVRASNPFGPVANSRTIRVTVR